MDASNMILEIENRGDLLNIVLPAIKENKMAAVFAPNSEYNIWSDIFVKAAEDLKSYRNISWEASNIVITCFLPRSKLKSLDFQSGSNSIILLK